MPWTNEWFSWSPPSGTGFIDKVEIQWIADNQFILFWVKTAELGSTLHSQRGIVTFPVEIKMDGPVNNLGSYSEQMVIDKIERTESGAFAVYVGLRPVICT